MKKSVLYIVLFFLSIISVGQNKNYFAQDLPFNSPEYKQQYIALLDSILIETSLRGEINFSEKLYQLTKKNDTLRFIFGSHAYARRLQYAGEFLNALPIFKEEIDLLNVFEPTSLEKSELEKNHLTKIEVITQLGNCFLATNEFDLAFEYYHKALEIAEKENLSFYKAVIPSLLGNLKFATDEYDEAIKYFNKALEDLELSDIDDINKKFNGGLIAIQKSQVYLKKKMLDSTQLVIENAENKGFFEVGYIAKTGFEVSKAEFLLEQNKANEALDLLLKLKKIADKDDPKFGILNYYNTLSKAYFKLAFFDEAIAVMEQGMLAKKVNYSDVFFTEDYKFLAEIYKAKDDVEKANYYLEKYILNQASIDKSKLEIIDLFHTKEVADLKIEKEHQKEKVNIISISAIVIILLLLFVVAKFYKKRKQNDLLFEQLHKKIANLNKSNAVLIDTKELTEDFEEKSSADLPNEVVEQILTGLKKLEEQNYFLKQECSSYNVAKKIKTNTSYLSKVINAEYQKNFNTYINDLRINYAIFRIENDRRFRSFSIQSIAEELGYKSADSFTKYFKLRTGLNPSFYIKKIKQSA